MRRLFISYRDENRTDWEIDPNVGKLTPDQPRRPPTNSTLKVHRLRCPVQGSELCEAQRALNSNNGNSKDNRHCCSSLRPPSDPGTGLSPLPSLPPDPSTTF